MSKCVSTSILGLVLIGLAAQPLYGVEEPPCCGAINSTARYGIHETPADPNSPLTFLITLSLMASAGDCTATGWAITTVEIRQIDPNSGPDTVWTQADPNVPTPDGLWWVNHADVASPQANEFVLPPHLVGTAIADDPNDADLEYDFVGVTYTPPAAPETPPYDVTAALDYALVRVGEEIPIGEGSAEPTEGDPPIAG
jgi:hypothetical protein